MKNDAKTFETVFTPYYIMRPDATGGGLQLASALPRGGAAMLGGQLAV